MKGTIIKFVSEKKFGFIKPDEGLGKDIFFCKAKCAEGTRMTRGFRVEFDLEETEVDGIKKVMAINVKNTGEERVRFEGGFRSIRNDMPKEWKR